MWSSLLAPEINSILSCFPALNILHFALFSRHALVCPQINSTTFVKEIAGRRSQCDNYPSAKFINFLCLNSLVPSKKITVLA